MKITHVISNGHGESSKGINIDIWDGEVTVENLKKNSNASVRVDYEKEELTLYLNESDLQFNLPEEEVKKIENFETVDGDADIEIKGKNEEYNIKGNVSIGCEFIKIRKKSKK